MTLTDIVKGIKNSIANVAGTVKNYSSKIAGAAAMAGALAITTDAQAQSFTSPHNQFEQTQKVQQEQKQNLEDTTNIDGVLEVGGFGTPDREGFGAAARLSTIFENGVGLHLYGAGGRQIFDVKGFPDLDQRYVRGMAGLSFELIKSPSLESYLELNAGGEKAEFFNNIELDLSRAIYGGQFGLASQNNGTYFLLQGYGSDGKHRDGILLDGTELGNKNFRNTFFSVDFAQALWTGEKTNIDFQTRYFDRDEVLNSFKDSLHLVMNAYATRDRFSGLIQTDAEGIRAGAQYVMNMRDYKEDENGILRATGLLWSFSALGEYNHSSSDSKLSDWTSTMNSRAIKLEIGLDVSEYVGFRIGGGIQWMDVKTRDPAFNLYQSDDHNGGMIYAGVQIRG